MDDRQRDLQEAVEDLAETLETLRTELGAPRGPLGAPRPPTPGEVLHFTESYTIPAIVSILETTIRALELLAAAIRLSEGRPVEGAARGGDPPAEDALVDVSRRTLRRLDDALASLGSAAASEGAADPQLRRLVEDARDLRAEVEDRLEDATAADAAPRSATRRRTDPEPIYIEVQAGDEEGAEADGDESAATDVDVDRELDSIKRELDGDEFDRAPDPEGDAGGPNDPDAGEDDDRGDGPADGPETRNGS